MTRAAAREAIAPSAVSKRLAELELNLGTALFERKQSGMERTPVGDTLFHHAQRLVLNAEQIVAEMAEHASRVRGFVRMLANLGAIVQFLPEDLQSFMAAHPAIRIDLEERPRGGVVTGVRDGSAEVGICSADAAAHGLRAQLYRSERLLVVMRSDHPLSAQDRIAFVDTLDHDHGDRDPGNVPRTRDHRGGALQLPLQPYAHEAGHQGGAGGDGRRLDRCALELSDAPLDVLGYACLVAIMSMGEGYDRASEARLHGVTRQNGRAIPVVTSAGALVHGLKDHRRQADRGNRTVYEAADQYGLRLH